MLKRTLVALALAAAAALTTVAVATPAQAGGCVYHDMRGCR